MIGNNRYELVFNNLSDFIILVLSICAEFSKVFTQPTNVIYNIKMKVKYNIKNKYFIFTLTLYPYTRYYLIYIGWHPESIFMAPIVNHAKNETIIRHLLSLYLKITLHSFHIFSVYCLHLFDNILFLDIILHICILHKHSIHRHTYI